MQVETSMEVAEQGTQTVTENEKMQPMRLVKLGSFKIDENPPLEESARKMVQELSKSEINRR